MKSVRKITYRIVLGLTLFACLMIAKQEQIKADSWSNAYEFFQQYGNQVQFCPTSYNDGVIYFATQGSNTNSTSGIRYRSIGWEISILDEYGNLLQVMYCVLDGGYMNCEHKTTVSNTMYKLYGIRLSSIRNRMSQNVKEKFEKGNCTIVFNACMVVRINGQNQGGMTDAGPSWGCVYTSYEGIANAQAWGNASKNALHSYFEKPVQGLYYSVNLEKGTGIGEVFGSGRYCYGTYVEISAQADYGYCFSHWTGTNVNYDNPYGFYVNGNYSWTANANPKHTTVVFHRNFDAADSISMTQIYSFTGTNQQFVDFGWQRPGYYPLGWAENPYSTANQYYLTNPVAAQWIEERYPCIDLYEIWKENEYTIVFDGNGNVEGKMEDVNINYTGILQMPENGFVCKNGNRAFLGWSLNPVASKGDYLVGEQISVSELVTMLQLENTTGAIIHVYAIWDEEPAILANDLYFSLLDAQQGKITEQKLAEYARAFDLEDGEINYGKNANNSFLLKDYDEKFFLSCSASAEIPVTFQAIDCSGNRVERQILIYIVDTSVSTGEEVFGAPRMISKKYFVKENGRLLSEQEGGLKASSEWRNNDTWRKLLADTLMRAEEKR